MPDPNLTIPESSTPDWVLRYNDQRARRYERRLERQATMLPRLRTRRARRTLVIVLAVAVLASITTSIIAFWHMKAMSIPFLIAVLSSVVALILLRISAGAISDAPADALDELQLAQRNAARSVACSVFVPVILAVYGIAIALSWRDYVQGETLAALAWLLISGTLAVTCLPDMLLTWWRPEDVDAADELIESEARS